MTHHPSSTSLDLLTYVPCSFDSGMAGGAPTPGINGGEYTTTNHTDKDGERYTLKQGMLGSHVLKPRPSGAVWKAGSEVNVSWCECMLPARPRISCRVVSTEGDFT